MKILGDLNVESEGRIYRICHMRAAVDSSVT